MVTEHGSHIRTAEPHVVSADYKLSGQAFSLPVLVCGQPLDRTVTRDHQQVQVSNVAGVLGVAQ